MSTIRRLAVCVSLVAAEHAMHAEGRDPDRTFAVGGFVNDCSSPDTIIARVRQSAADLIASGELTIVSSSLGAFAGAPRSEIAS